MLKSVLHIHPSCSPISGFPLIHSCKYCSKMLCYSLSHLNQLCIENTFNDILDRQFVIKMSLFMLLNLSLSSCVCDRLHSLRSRILLNILLMILNIGDFLRWCWLFCVTGCCYDFANGLKAARVVKLMFRTVLWGIITYVWTTCILCAAGVISNPCAFGYFVEGARTQPHWKMGDRDTGGFSGEGGWVGGLMMFMSFALDYEATHTL